MASISRQFSYPKGTVIFARCFNFLRIILFSLLGLRSVDSSSELCYYDSVNPSTVALPAVAEPETRVAEEDGVEFPPPKVPLTPAAPSRVTEGGERPFIHQVVLPLPGYDVVFPDNESKLVVILESHFGPLIISYI